MEDNKKTILVIDDSPTVRRLIELILADEGYKIITAEDGEQGIRIAREKNPSLILVDFLMPKMNGFQFCKVLRSDIRFKDIPIILITSKDKDVGQTFEERFGTIEYFHKPFEPDDLARKVNELMEKVIPEDARAEIILEDDDEKIILDDFEKEIVAGEAEEKAVSEDVQELVLENAEGVVLEDIEEAVLTNGEEIVVDEAAEAAPAPSSSSIPALEKTVENIMEKYFKVELQLMLKNILIDTLREMEMIKGETLGLSGHIAHIPMPDLLQFLAALRMTGKLSILTPSLYADVYLERGFVVFANMSKKGFQKFFTDFLIEDGIIGKEDLVRLLDLSRERRLPIGRIMVEQGYVSEDRLMHYLRRITEDSFYTVIEADAGSFYFERTSLPLNLSDIKFRLPMTNLILDGLRRLDEKKVAAERFNDDSAVLSRMITNAEEIESIELREKELRVFSLVDGKRTLREIITRSKMDELEVKRICYSLQKVGLLKIKDR